MVLCDHAILNLMNGNPFMEVMDLKCLLIHPTINIYMQNINMEILQVLKMGDIFLIRLRKEFRL